MTQQGYKDTTSIIIAIPYIPFNYKSIAKKQKAESVHRELGLISILVIFFDFFIFWGGGGGVCMYVNLIRV